MDKIERPSHGETVSPWTEAQTKRLIGLWHERLSAARIARALGPKFSRSAVVGKLFRLGLQRTGEQRYDAQAAGARHSRDRRRAVETVAGLRPPILPIMPLPPPTPCAVIPQLVGLLELHRTSCRWPYELGDETRFCGHRVRGEGPYCPDHHAIAYSAVLPPLTLEAVQAAPRRSVRTPDAAR
ncbi:MAG TPA: GcrA family cell cycle regulator [Caulobacteraceae bacterium]|jgi:hypothetical protein|nr:GcrA family cell cycle regulator [Caulobacteraceae bacterium]